MPARGQLPAVTGNRNYPQPVKRLKPLALGYKVSDYCQSHGFYYIDRVGPLTLERFLGYADWYTEQLVPYVRDVTVADIKQTGGGFQVAFADAEPVTARQVVVVTGVLPYAHIRTSWSACRPSWSHTPATTAI